MRMSEGRRVLRREEAKMDTTGNNNTGVQWTFWQAHCVFVSKTQLKSYEAIRITVIETPNTDTCCSNTVIIIIKNKTRSSFFFSMFL